LARTDSSGSARNAAHRQRSPSDVRLHEIALCRPRIGIEARARQADRLKQPLLDVVPVRDAADALDDDAEEREREVRVVEACAGRQHVLRPVERLEQLGHRREPLLEPRVVVRLTLQAGRVREQAADRRRVRGGLDVRVEAILEIELSRVAELDDRGGGEGLRDRAEAVLRVGRRAVTDRCFPDGLPVAKHRGGDAREPLVALLARDATLELGRKQLRRGHGPRSGSRPPRRRRRR